MGTTALSAYKSGQRSARGKSKRRSKRFTVPLAVVAGFGPMAVDVIHGYRTGGIESAANDLLANLTGYSHRDKSWSFSLLAKGMGPVLAGVMVHKLAGRLGINGFLSRAGIPLLRI